MRTTALVLLLAMGVSMGASAAPLGTHAVRGVVKSVSASSLIIARSGRRPVEMMFVLDSSTVREGEIHVGAMVSIRYVTDGKTLIATAVSAHPEDACRRDFELGTRTRIDDRMNDDRMISCVRA